ncbi:MAG: V-type ATP synthase subunit F [Candidatus Hydrogenedentota bacterium]
MSKVIALATDNTALNLMLTGVTVEEPADVKQAESRLDELLQGGVDVLIIEEKLRDAFGIRMHERLANHAGDPLIVYCPAFDEEDSDVDAYLSSIIKPAVGFEIRLA